MRIKTRRCLGTESPILIYTTCRRITSQTKLYKSRTHADKCTAVWKTELGVFKIAAVEMFGLAELMQTAWLYPDTQQMCAWRHTEIHIYNVAPTNATECHKCCCRVLELSKSLLLLVIVKACEMTVCVCLCCNDRVGIQSFKWRSRDSNCWKDMFYSWPSPLTWHKFMFLPVSVK